jgi:uncharacterized protein (TIGR02145 family)
MKLYLVILFGLFAASICTAEETNTTVTDIDGNVYHKVKIGDQVWMVENLRTTTYSDGYPIDLDTSATSWISGTNGKYCYYNNTTNTDSIKKFGALYNWWAVDTKKLAPVGWHVPTDEDWQTLENYLSYYGYNWDGTKEGNKCAKSLAAKTDWQMNETAGAIGNDCSKNDTTGFSALPGGYRLYTGKYGNIGYYGHWWSGTGDSNFDSASMRMLSYLYDELTWLSCSKACACSVRLIKGY